MRRLRSLDGSKGALYRETLQATGFYVGRVVIATAEFTPMPPSEPGYPGGTISTAIGMRFRRHGGIYRPMWGSEYPFGEPLIHLPAPSRPS